LSYDHVPGEEREQRTIHPREAETVRAIFRLVVNGVSPRAIAQRLDAENVPGPELRPWLETTIGGQKERGTGLLNNELYAGQLVCNLCPYVRDLDAGPHHEALRNIRERVVVTSRDDSVNPDLSGDLAGFLAACLANARSPAFLGRGFC
jgi:hypothetical protein